ncbi:hypothetical protein C8039_14285 [Halogeometricum sp. wsp3]|nr:hypothetical protein C8039_14285 [Halogeometricum sp. wsp3]
MKARAELRRQIREYEWDGIVDAFRKTSDVTTLTAFTEDTIALLGAGIALVGVILAEITGNAVYDLSPSVSASSSCRSLSRSRGRTSAFSSEKVSRTVEEQRFRDIVMRTNTWPTSSASGQSISGRTRSSSSRPAVRPGAGHGSNR